MFLLLVLLVFVAVQVQPQHITLDSQPGASVSEIITVTNTQARPITYAFTVDSFSEYLTETISPRQETFVLGPQASKNIQIHGQIPVLGPETHTLIYNIQEDGVQVESVTLDIPVSGTGELEPGLSVSANDARAGSSLLADARLTNFGNLIAYYSLTMRVLEQGAVIGEITYPQKIQVLPGEQESITLLYTDYLEPGNYNIELVAEVNEQITLEEIVPVIVTLQEESRTISQGDDLIIELKRYQSQPRVQYQVLKNNQAVLEETFIAHNDSIVIGTHQLSEGTYVVEIEIISDTGSDTQSFDLVIASSAHINSWPIIIILLIGLAIFVFLEPVRRYLRILVLSAKINAQEKRLNSLLSQIQSMEERIARK